MTKETLKHLPSIVTEWLKPYLPAFLWNFLKRRSMIIRYLFAGGSSAVTNLSILYVATDIFGVWYVSSAVLAFTFSFMQSFLLQKYWTFQEMSSERANKQLVYTLVIGTINLSLNTLLIFSFVEYLGVWYILAEIFAGAILAFESFLVYRFLIFRKTIPEHSNTYGN